MKKLELKTKFKTKLILKRLIKYINNNKFKDTMVNQIIKIKFKFKQQIIKFQLNILMSLNKQLKMID